MNRETGETRQLADRGVALCEEQSNGFYLQFNRMIRGWAYLETGDPTDCVEEMQQGMSAFRKSGARVFIPYFFALQAEGLAKIGKPDEGLGVVDEALSIIENTGERCWEADVHRVKGDLILAVSGAASEAEKSYLEAIQIAQGQDAKSWQLRAAISLARLWRDQGKHTEAARLLAEIYGWFTEGFDTPDLSEAKQLLQELSGRQVA